MSIVKVEDIYFKRGNNQILQSVDWEIVEGQQWGLLGLNGSGKTSLLSIISTYEIPSSGEVEVLGKRFGRTYLPDLRKKIGYVSTSLEKFSDFFWNETIERVIISGKFASFGIYEKVLDEDWVRADFLVKEFRLEHVKRKKFNLLSEGEKRRVLIARALMGEPKLLILDEPCSGLDILAREQFLEALKIATESHVHIVYVTHHIEELVPEITHVLLLKDGQVVAAGPKHEVMTSELLSETYQVPVAIEWRADRPYLSIE
ncbi:ATP-binding cassette domain-containing protein [Sporosarcina sp. PTS2304]|uniref:ABC transporter ATP-binding protein n=1 Tax=Sporosarcina sp. PTS2304 TaxID=2283194 RepID=UPI000E0D2130|nr:ATP-binding cassette domain-containing protein [Sporosarcina sp. PTS2304]AXI00487.1 ATP-binding cassette domain-containing protein [Sporosarcina sp. PTS2304]